MIYANCLDKKVSRERPFIKAMCASYQDQKKCDDASEFCIWQEKAESKKHETKQPETKKDTPKTTKTSDQYRTRTLKTTSDQSVQNN